MGNKISIYSSAALTDVSSENGTHFDFVYAAASVQGWEHKQQDAYKIITDFHEGLSYFAVFDGHGGSEISEFLKIQLHNYIKGFLMEHADIELALYLGFLSCDSSLRSPEVKAVLNALIKAENDVASRIMRSRYLKFVDDSSSGIIEQSFETLRRNTEDISSINHLLNDVLDKIDSEEDADFNVEDEWSSSESINEEMPIDAEAILTQEPADLSGSTATIALLSKSKIFVSNVGDTRCVLSRNGQAIDMSLDHNPHNSEELVRIKNAGGTVSADGRVNNFICLSRAFGDFKLKGPSPIPVEQCITAEPFVKSIDIKKEDDFLVIASDGIWNSFTSKELIDYLHIRIKTEDKSLTVICEEIFQLLIPPKLSDDGTGCDNMTLIIILLNTNEVKPSSSTEVGSTI